MKQKFNFLALLLALMVVLSACAGIVPGEDVGQVPASNSSRGEGDEGDAPVQGETHGEGQEPEQNGNQENDSEQEQEETSSGTEDQSKVQASETDKAYEEYLSALSLLALSMEYPDFQLQGVYAASRVSVENKSSSQGIYVLFESQGEDLCLHVFPIAAERNEAGSRDVFASELGYAAFDLQPEIPAVDGLTLLEAKDYGELLSKLSGVALYNH